MYVNGNKPARSRRSKQFTFDNGRNTTHPLGKVQEKSLGSNASPCSAHKSPEPRVFRIKDQNALKQKPQKIASGKSPLANRRGRNKAVDLTHQKDMALTSIDYQMKLMQEEIQSMKQLMQEKDDKIQHLKQQKQMYHGTMDSSYMNLPGEVEMDPGAMTGSLDMLAQNRLYSQREQSKSTIKPNIRLLPGGRGLVGERSSIQEQANLINSLSQQLDLQSQSSHNDTGIIRSPMCDLKENTSLLSGDKSLTSYRQD